MQIDQRGQLFLEQCEGVRYTVYPDSGGAPSIGIGHLLTRSERMAGVILIMGKQVAYANGLTLAECRALLDQDVVPAEQAVNAYVKSPLAQNQFNALTSFVFNVGKEAFVNSTLLKMINRDRLDLVPAQITRWVYDNGVVVQGLVNRREREVALWNEG